MSVVYTLFKHTGEFCSYCFDIEHKTNELIDGIWKETPIDEWEANYESGRKFPVLNIPDDRITWRGRPTKAQRDAK